MTIRFIEIEPNSWRVISDHADLGTVTSNHPNGWYAYSARGHWIGSYQTREDATNAVRRIWEGRRSA